MHRPCCPAESVAPVEAGRKHDFCFDLGASWPSFIDLSKTLAEQILNSGKEKDIDHDDDRQLLLDDLHDPFLSAAAKALEKSAGADCRTPLYNHG